VVKISEIEKLIENIMKFNGDGDLRDYCLITNKLVSGISRITDTKFGGIEVITSEDIPPGMIYCVKFSAFSLKRDLPEEMEEVGKVYKTKKII
jgi:hypothetical protein